MCAHVLARLLSQIGLNPGARIPPLTLLSLLFLSLLFLHAHSVDCLDPTKTVLQFFKDTYPNDINVGFQRSEEEWRGFIGRYGISGKMQNTKISMLSDGQQSRIVFAMICLRKPNLLLLDEPTNHLDIEAIDSLAGRS